MTRRSQPPGKPPALGPGARADLGVSEAVELCRRFRRISIGRPGIGVGAVFGERVEIAQEPSMGPVSTVAGGSVSKRLADAINTARQVVEPAGVDRRGAFGRAIS